MVSLVIGSSHKTITILTAWRSYGSVDNYDSLRTVPDGKLIDPCYIYFVLRIYSMFMYRRPKREIKRTELM